MLKGGDLLKRRMSLASSYRGVFLLYLKEIKSLGGEVWLCKCDLRQSPGNLR